jgi:phage nucleotide-binding protein
MAKNDLAGLVEDDLSEHAGGPISESHAKASKVLKTGSIGGLEIRSVTEQTDFLNILVYGDPGIGKTRFAGSASLVPELSPVLVIDVEGGTMSLADDYKNVDVVRVTKWGDIANVYEAVFDNPDLYRTVVLDSLSEMQKFSMVEIMKAAVKKNPDRDIEVPGMREWGINGEQIRTLVRAFRDAGLNVIATSHAMDDQSEGGAGKTKPALTGKLRNEVAGFFDMVFYLYNKKIKEDDNTRRIANLLLSKGTPEVIAKDRSGRVPEVMEDPTMTLIYQYFKGN